MCFGDRTRGVGEIGLGESSEEVNIGERIAKNKGDGVKSVCGDKGHEA